ncbi:unnamed protein product [Durusdinium trenchii]|uniref:Uncharacterized protein n=1 Tax=Durusdinium trenchii TaxID=1381693 RepID=A0ABP0JZF8_9DINO
MTRFAMALGALAFLWTIPAAATGTGYQKYISQYAGDYLHQFGQGSGYQDYIQTYTGMKSGAQTEEDTQPISLMADMSEGHTDKQESPSGAGYQKYMAQYANDFQKYMQGQGKGGAQGGDYQKYMAQFANDFEKYLQGQGKGGDYQKYMSQHMDDFQKYMQGQGKSTQSGEDKIGHVVEQKLKKDEGKDAGSSEAHHGKKTASVILAEEASSPPAALLGAPLLLLVLGGMAAIYIERQRGLLRHTEPQQPEGYLQLESVSESA